MSLPYFDVSSEAIEILRDIEITDIFGRCSASAMVIAQRYASCNINCSPITEMKYFIYQA